MTRSPIHSLWPSYRNELDYQSLLKNELNDVEYLDFSKFPLSNKEFGDLGHLNHKGAAIFSNWFQKALDDGLLDMTAKQDYIDKEFARMKSRLDAKE